MQRSCVWLCAAFVVGCSHAHQDPIIGTWTAKITLNGAQIDEQETYAPDGGYSGNSVASRPDMKASLHIHDIGNWKGLGGDRYEERLADTDWVTENAATAAGAAKAAARFKQNKAKIIAGSNKDPDFTVKWLSDDMFTVKRNDMIVTYSRQK